MYWINFLIVYQNEWNIQFCYKRHVSYIKHVGQKLSFHRCSFTNIMYNIGITFQWFHKIVYPHPSLRSDMYYILYNIPHIPLPRIRHVLHSMYGISPYTPPSDPTCITSHYRLYPSLKSNILYNISPITFQEPICNTFYTISHLEYLRQIRQKDWHILHFIEYRTY